MIGEAAEMEKLSALAVLDVVAGIPAGFVTTYGEIAHLLGWEKNARQVGKILAQAECYGDYPCHRVVNHAGRTVPGWPEQRALLEQEGVGFRENGCVDMKHFLWRF